MKLTQLFLFVAFAVLLDVSMLRGATLLSAAYSINATASDPTTNPHAQSALATGGDTLVPLHEVEGGELLFEGHTEAERGNSLGSINSTVRASIGSIGVSIVGGVHGDTLGTGGEAEIQTNSVFASWRDTSIVTARGKANGQRLIFNTFINLDGEMTASVSGTDRFARPAGNAFGYLDVFESSPEYDLPAAPYADGHWARIIENPGGNQHILDEAPGALHIRHFMTVGQPYTLSFGMTLTARSRAFDGGTALLTANFSSSLKWGGIESVTDLEGNPIPREDWTITSESGFDYSRSFDGQVPEPASLGLISLTIGLFLARSRVT